MDRDRCKTMVIEEEKGQIEAKLTAETAVSNQLRQSVKTLTVSAFLFNFLRKTVVDLLSPCLFMQAFGCH